LFSKSNVKRMPFWLYRKLILQFKKTLQVVLGQYLTKINSDYCNRNCTNFRGRFEVDLNKAPGMKKAGEGPRLWFWSAAELLRRVGDRAVDIAVGVELVAGICRDAAHGAVHPGRVAVQQLLCMGLGVVARATRPLFGEPVGGPQARSLE
jgi:hypothetical protein